MVLDEYRQVYIGATSESAGTAERIRQHWSGQKQFDRLLAGSVETSVLSIDSFRPRHHAHLRPPGEQARLARLQEIREGMESLRIEALAERGGRTFTTEEALEFIRRQDLAEDTTASWVLEASSRILQSWSESSHTSREKWRSRS